MANILQPPSTNVPAVEDERGRTMDFTPLWRKWFIELVDILNTSGGTEGSLAASGELATVTPLSGGGLLSEGLTIRFTPAGNNGNVQYNNNGNLGALPGINANVVLTKLTPAGANGLAVFTRGVLTAYTPPT